MAEHGHIEILDQVLQTGEPYVGTDAPVVWQPRQGVDGSRTGYVSFIHYPLTDTSGGACAVVTVARDVTESVLALREARRRAAFAERLQAATAALARASTPEEIASAVLSEGRAAADAAAGLVFRLGEARMGEDPACLYPTGTGGFGPEVEQAWRSVAVNVDAGVSEVLRTRTPLWQPTPASRSERYPHLVGQPISTSYGSWAFLPLMVEAIPVGSITFAWANPQPGGSFTSELQSFLLALADQCAISLERVRLYAAERIEREDAQRARQEADTANQAKSMFLANMSHELRTPINAIVGYVDLLEMGISGPLNDAQRQQLERVKSSSVHLLQLVNEILDLARIEAGQLAVDRGVHSAADTIRGAIAMIEPQARLKRIGIEEEFARSELHYLGDADRVRQIILNLLSNAVKFTDPGGLIRVRADLASHPRLPDPGRCVRVHVEDTGIGIPPDQLGAIFEPFIQGSAGLTRSSGGAGLGLAISQRLARKMGGDLTVRSTVGEGSRFTLWLPVASDPADADATRQRWPGAPREVALLSEVGRTLARAAEDIVEVVTHRLRTGPEIPGADALDRAQLENHAATFLVDIGLSLVTLDEGGGEPAPMRDGTEIQQLISQLHGAQRARLGWTEAALRQEFRILREEVEIALRRSLATADGEIETALGITRRLLEQAERMSLRGFRTADVGRT